MEGTYKSVGTGARGEIVFSLDDILSHQTPWAAVAVDWPDVDYCYLLQLITDRRKRVWKRRVMYKYTLKKKLLLVTIVYTADITSGTSRENLVRK